MSEFSVTVRYVKRRKQVFIVSAEAVTKKETEGQIRYLVNI